MTAIEQEQRDEAIAEALTAGRSVRAVRKQFGISIAELDGALERLFPIDAVARLRMIKTDLGKLDRLTEVFYSKALGGCIQSGLLTVQIWERKHELLGMNAAAKFEVIAAPPDAPTRHQKIYAALMNLKHGPDWRSGAVGALSPPAGNGSGGPAASDTSETS